MKVNLAPHTKIRTLPTTKIHAVVDKKRPAAEAQTHGGAERRSKARYGRAVGRTSVRRHSLWYDSMRLAPEIRSLLFLLLAICSTEKQSWSARGSCGKLMFELLTESRSRDRRH